MPVRQQDARLVIQHLALLPVPSTPPAAATVRASTCRGGTSPMRAASRRAAPSHRCAATTSGALGGSQPGTSPPGTSSRSMGAPLAMGAPTLSSWISRRRGECDRNGDCTITEDTRASFDFSSDNLGGSFTGVCGDPSSESMQVDLARSGCDAVTYQLVVHDSAPSSVFDLALVATRCRCDIGWDPCVDPLPADPCAP